MVKKSVTKATNIISKQFKELMNTHNILSSLIVILLVVYMSFVNVSNVPQIFNNVIVKLVLFGLIVYTFYHDKLVALILAITVILSISLSSKSKYSKLEAVNNTLDEESIPLDDSDIVDNMSMPPSMEEAPTEQVPVNQSPIEPSGVEISYNTQNPRLGLPMGVPSDGLKISNYSNA